MSLSNMTATELNQIYRDVFSTERGQIVLIDILNDCGFYGLHDMVDKADIARFNVGRRILGKCGIWEPVHIEELTKILVEERKPRGLLRRLFQLPIVRDKGVNDV
jgi:hypothetical protein